MKNFFVVTRSHGVFRYKSDSFSVGVSFCSFWTQGEVSGLIAVSEVLGIVEGGCYEKVSGPFKGEDRHV
jgi:hypothetical protein